MSLTALAIVEGNDVDLLYAVETNETWKGERVYISGAQRKLTKEQLFTEAAALIKHHSGAEIEGHMKEEFLKWKKEKQL